MVAPAPLPKIPDTPAAPPKPEPPKAETPPVEPMKDRRGRVVKCDLRHCGQPVVTPHKCGQCSGVFHSAECLAEHKGKRRPWLHPKGE